MTPEKLPEKLGRYEILDELGKGAMGVVYLARDPLIGRQLALKTFHLGYSAGDKELEQFRTRFLREAQSAGILNHPNIVTIHDVVVDPGGDFFIAMEYVQGTDLKLVMQRQGRFDLAFAVDVVAQIAEGLGYAHSKGVVHRDVKPANIILTADKQPKITDFGIARVEASNLTMEGQLLGTPNYMAPEQIQGKEVDHRADLFSLGVMLYEMLSGRKPFAADNLTAVTHKIVFEPFPPLGQVAPGLPPGINRVLERALAKDPAERYDRGEEMAADLRAALAPAAAHGSSFLSPVDASSTPAPPTHPIPRQPAAPPAPQPAAARPDPAPQPGAPQPGAPQPGAPQPTLAPVVPGTPPPAALAPSPPAPVAAARTPFLKVPAGGRMALAAGIALTLGLVAAGIAKLALKDEEPPRRDGAQLQRQVELLPFLKRGRELLEAGEPAAALEAFERAVAIAPDDRDVRHWRDRARQAVAQLESESAGAEDGRAARPTAAVRDRPAVETPAAGRPAPGSPAPGSPAAATPAGKGTLTIELVSKVSEGRLTVFNGQQRICHENFRFVTPKTGLFGRERKTSGSLTKRLALPSGALDLRIYVWRQDAQTRSAEVKDDLPPGGSRTLRVDVSQEGRLSVRLD